MEDKLISEVSKHIYIYDRRNPIHKNKSAIEHAWEDISTKLNIDGRLQLFCLLLLIVVSGVLTFYFCYYYSKGLYQQVELPSKKVCRICSYGKISKTFCGWCKT